MGRSGKSNGRIISIIIYVAVGIILGRDFSVIYKTYLRVSMDMGLSEFFKALLILYVFVALTLYAALAIQVIIHESGHMVFGLLTGYKLVSFRIFSFVWIRSEGKVRFKRMSVPGTAGQCLMSPPDLVDGRMPVFLYNLGGALMNLVFSIIFFCLSRITLQYYFLSVFLKTVALIGVSTALTNGIPMHLGTITNDGANALLLKKDKDATRAFWIQLKINEQIANGIRLRYMPEEWFEVPSDEAMENSIIASIGVLAANKLMDERKFGKVKSLTTHLLEVGGGIIGLHRCLLVCDLIYIELMEECREDIIEMLLSKEQKKIMKAMKTSITVLRTEYALALLHEKDEDKAKAIEKRFERVARKYPYPSELSGERELVAAARSCAEGKKNK
ncbi:MAG: M50 family metallopeptidase [Firmicutes bacterium]|nr:M50 family metallopeptidase [Bacillota bacterium]